MDKLNGNYVMITQIFVLYTEHAAVDKAHQIKEEYL